MHAALRNQEPWVQRLGVPAYSVSTAASYARIGAATVLAWQRGRGESGPALSTRPKGAALSYLQLVELRIVAAMRELGVPLKKIRNAREYLVERFNNPYPFADERLKTDGQDVILDLGETDGPELIEKVLIANKGGQYKWRPMMVDRFTEFDYEHQLAARWHVDGASSPIVIDPKIAFGKPSVEGVPTWILAEREKAGESVSEIARDYRLRAPLVRMALKFEASISQNARSRGAWPH